MAAVLVGLGNTAHPQRQGVLGRAVILVTEETHLAKETLPTAEVVVVVVVGTQTTALGVVVLACLERALLALAAQTPTRTMPPEAEVAPVEKMGLGKRLTIKPD